MLNRSHTLAATVAILSGVATADIYADVIIAPANAADGIVYKNPSSADPANVGNGNDSGLLSGLPSNSHHNAILVFELPTLPDGEFIQSANLNVTLSRSDDLVGVNLDVYGLGTRSAADILPGDWHGAGNDPDATLIQAALMTPDTVAGTAVDTNDVGDAALAAFLQSQYDAGAEAGEFVFFRLNTDAAPNIDSWYYVHPTEHTANAPVLTITTAIPEPASLALIGLGGLAMLGRSHRSAR